VSIGAAAAGELTDEQREIRALAARFADEVVAPRAAEWDREHRFPREVFAQMGELGLVGSCIPEEHGGAGADFFSYVLVMEQISRGDAGLGVTLAVQVGAGALPIVAHGTSEQIERLVPPLARGEELCAFALTEPGSGSDAAALQTRAVGGRLTGSKQFVTSGSHADTLIVFARDPERTREEGAGSEARDAGTRSEARETGARSEARETGARSEARETGISAFLTRGDAPGVSVLREEEKLGLHSSSTAALSFEDTPAEPLGEPGAGMRIALSTLDGGRISISAQAVGIAQAALDVATAYARERRAFGRPIGGFQAIAHKLADMQTEIEAARALTYRAARLKAAGRPHTVEGAQAKLFASAVARRQTGEAIQVLGGYGYTREFPAERYYRDAKVTEIYEGTSEIQRLVIARALLGEIGA
jgi:alkylation response protein AidB-like acyl-CoA dehydrogenase